MRGGLDNPPPKFCTVSLCKDLIVRFERNLTSLKLAHRIKCALPPEEPKPQWLLCCCTLATASGAVVLQGSRQSRHRKGLLKLAKPAALLQAKIKIVAF